MILSILFYILKAIGRRIEYSIDSLGYKALIMLNKGDQKLKNKIDKKHKKGIRNIILGFILSIIASSIGTLIINYIFK